MAPILTGWLKQKTGSYDAPMLACCVFLVVGVLSYLIIMVKERYAPGGAVSMETESKVTDVMISGMTPPPTPFVRRKPRRLAKEVADALAIQIRNHVLRSGAKLPTESEIMLEHGVSRTVVREAISGLQAAGLVETRHGIGTFVLDSPTGFEFRVEAQSIPTVHDILAMLELRISLEPEAAARAAERRTADQLKELKRVLDEFQAALRNGGDAAEPDFQFHLRVAEATGNRYFPEVLARFGTTTIPRTRVSLLQSAGDQAAYLRSLSREHEQIYDAILRGDPKGAAKFMRTHLTNSRDRFKRAEDAG